MNGRGRYVLWLGPIFNEEAVHKYRAVTPAAVRWMSGFVQHLMKDRNVIAMGHLLEPMWPKGKFWINSCPDLVKWVPSYLVPNLNLPLVRETFYKFAYLNTVKNIIKEKGLPSAIISYNTNVFYDFLAKKLKKYGVKWFPVILDFGGLDEKFQKIQKLSKSASGYIFVSHWGYQNAPFKNKFHLDGGVNSFVPCEHSQIKKSFLYSGMFSKWGGLDLLLDAFSLIRDPDIELWICGHGSNDRLKKAIQQDARIKLFGLVSGKELEDLSLKASVFINPRPSGVDGNSINFPSKLLEYLRYCKPIVSTITPGVDPLYKKILFFPQEESPLALSKKMSEAVNLSEAQRLVLKEDIIHFVLTNKTWDIHLSRMLPWIDSIIGQER